MSRMDIGGYKHRGRMLRGWVEKAYSVEVQSPFDVKEDMEMTCLLNAYLCNGKEWTIDTSIQVPFNNESRYGIITNANIVKLDERIRDIEKQGGLLESYKSHLMQKSCKYAHDALAMMLCGGTCLPSPSSNGTFFRYNLFLYWVTYHFRVWKDVDTSKALLPCNDLVFEKAYLMGIIKKRVKSCLKNTIMLTSLARKVFGDNDFYRMYELLRFYEV